MARRTDDGARPDPLAQSIWEGIAELADWPAISPTVEQALQRLEAFREQKRIARRKAARSASATLGALAVVCATVGALVWPQTAQPGGACYGLGTGGATLTDGRGDAQRFDGASLGAVVAEMNRHARRPIVLNGSWQDDHRLTARMCPGDTAALAALLVDWGVAQQTEVSEEAIILTAACGGDCAALQRG